jgi:pyruvate kinase
MNNHPRQTKIVITLGPATDRPGVMDRLMAAGVDVVRVNFSHGDPDDHRNRVEAVRAAAERVGAQVAVLGDLQGPKIRIERFDQGAVELQAGDPFALDIDLVTDAGNQREVGLAYKDLPRDVVLGDILLLDDGRIELKVTGVNGGRIETLVEAGGRLSNNKGLNRRGGGLSAPPLTAKDRRDIRLAAELGVDYLAVSFPKNEDDMNEARGLLLEAGHDAGLVAKIERTEAVTNINEIMWASDAVMVARGDLGVEIGDAALAGVQKNILRRATELDCVVITATQMMESMVENPIPTRAELLDVANAVLDGTDAVMLSAETAVGRYPVQVVEAMDRICRGAETHRMEQPTVPQPEQHYERADEAIAKAAMFAANHFKVQAIAALTESGSTAMWMSRIRSRLPVFALTPSPATARRVALYRGVHPLVLPPAESGEPSDRAALRALLESEAMAPGELVMMTLGDHAGMPGATNTLKILRVGARSADA